MRIFFSLLFSYILISIIPLALMLLTPLLPDVVQSTTTSFFIYLFSWGKSFLEIVFYINFFDFMDFTVFSDF